MKYLIVLPFLFVACSFSHAITVTTLSDFEGNEQYITHVDLSNKGLTEFPVEILKCKNLKKLNLSNNGLLNIPIELGQLSELKMMDLSQNPSLNPASIDDVMKAALFSLEELYLSQCNLLFLSDAIANNRNLSRLNVAGNRLTNIPYTFMGLSKLQTIDLSDNFLKDASWVLGYWWSLKELNISDNEDLNTANMLAVLSFFDQLDRLEVGPVDYFPKEFLFLNVHELVVRNSVVEDLPANESSRKINRIVFDNCQFKNAHQLVSSLNDFSQPDYIEFRNTDAATLMPFLKVEADSVKLVNLGLTDIRPLAAIKELSWLDLRGNQISSGSISEFSLLRPDVTVLRKEPLPMNIGINPPIEQFTLPTDRFLATQTSQGMSFDVGKSDISIPANGLLDQNGNVYTGEVNFEYREFMNPADIFLSGITMTAGSADEPMLFSSGGMIELNATDNLGNQLQVNPEAPISVELFSSTPNPAMNVYQLDSAGVWQTIGQDEITTPFKVDSVALDSVLSQDFMAIARSEIRLVSDRYVPFAKLDRKGRSFEIGFTEYRSDIKKKGITVGNEVIQVFSTNYIGKFLCKNRLMFEGDSVDYYFDKLKEINKECRKQYRRLRVGKRSARRYTVLGPNFLDNFSISPDFEKDVFNLDFTFKGEKIQLPVSIQSNETRANYRMKEARFFFTKYWKAQRAYEKIYNTNQRKLKFVLEERERILVSQAKQEEINRQREYEMNRDYLNEMVGEGSITRAFTLTGFGVWNCDALSRMSSPLVIPPTILSSKGDFSGDEIDRTIVIDHGSNGVIQFAEGSKGFFDGGSRSTIVFFVGATLVGIWQSWKDQFTTDQMNVRMLDISGMNKEAFVNCINGTDVP